MNSEELKSDVNNFRSVFLCKTETEKKLVEPFDAWR